MKLLKFELIEIQKACQRKSQLMLYPADQHRIFHKSNYCCNMVLKMATKSRMCSDKADRPSAIVIKILYSTCIWEIGTVKVFDLIGNIISSVSTTTWMEIKIDSMYIGKGGALNKGLRLI